MSATVRVCAAEYEVVPGDVCADAGRQDIFGNLCHSGTWTNCLDCALSDVHLERVVYVMRDRPNHAVQIGYVDYLRVNEHELINTKVRELLGDNRPCPAQPDDDDSYLAQASLASFSKCSNLPIVSNLQFVAAGGWIIDVMNVVTDPEDANGCRGT